MKEYANLEVLVTTEWVAEHLDDPGVRIVESDEDVILYEVGHVPGAVKVDWQTELQDQLIALILRKGKTFVPGGDVRLAEGDRITIIGETDSIAQLREHYQGGPLSTPGSEAKGEQEVS